MRILFIFSFLMVFQNVLIAQTNDLRLNVYFDSDKALIKPDEKKKLDEFLSKFDLERVSLVNLVGHTDSNADSLYNIELSKRRCEAIKDYMVNKGIPAPILRSQFRGENMPVSDNETDEGKQFNRRVTVRVVLKPILVEEIIENYVEDNIPPPVPVYIPDPCIGVDTTIILANGTEMVFNKCEYDELKDCLEITSILNAEELIESNISMETTDAIPLVSCGMIRICFRDDCPIKKSCFNNPVTVRFPFPDETDRCESCPNRSAQFFNMTLDGTWEASTKKSEKITEVEIDGRKYYEMVIKCPNCGFQNCDCKRCEDEPWRIRRKMCPKIKMKLPHGYKLIQGRIYASCPTTYLGFSPKKKKFSRKNIGKTRSKCYYGDKQIKVLAVNPAGDTVHVNLRDLNTVKHRILFSHCKTKDRNTQKTFGLFRARDRAFHRKYKIREIDFQR